MRTRAVLPAAALAGLLLAACSSGGDTSVLEQNLDAQGTAIDALQQRVSELVDRVDAAESLNPNADVPGLVERVDGLATDMDELRTAVDDAVSATEGSDAETAARLGGIEERIDEVVADLQDLARLLSDLEARVEDLEEQQSGPFGD